MSSKHAIYTVSSAKFSAGGKTFDVSYVSMALAMNSVPTCEIGIAPDAATGQIKIDSIDLSSVKAVFSDLSKKAKEHASSSLHITLSPSDDSPFPGQSINLDGWLLVSCGMTDVSPVSNFSLTCIIAHPACQLSFRSGCFFNGAGVIDFSEYVGGVTSPINAAKQTIDATIKANSTEIKTLCSTPSFGSTPLKNENEIKSDLEAGMESLKGMIDSLLSWEPGYTGGSNSLPCGDLGDPVPYGVKYALMHAWSIPVGSQSFWEKLVGGDILGDFCIEIEPTFMESHLVAAPANPYGGPEISISTDSISIIDMPGFDPDPIYGVIMYQEEGTTEPAGGVTFEDMSTASAFIQPVNMAFVPVSQDLAGGSLIHCGDPAWLQYAMTKAAQSEDTNPEDAGGNTYEYKKDSPEALDEEIRKSLELWNEVRLRALVNAFMLRYRQGVTAHISCPLQVQTKDGDYVIPGSILSVNSGGELFKGKIQTVTHNIDCVSSRAVTEVRLAYCDTDGGSSNVLGSPVRIPFYNTTGD